MNLVFAAANPAGGAATQDIVLATGGAMILTMLVVVTGVLYRSGKVAWLHQLADFSERQWGLPAWVALAGEISSVSLLIALAGMYWDISLHINNGRDPGPLANPAHYLILFGLFGVFVAGFFSIIMGDHRGGSSMIQRAKTWKIPIGGIMLFACASFSLLGFPLDDGWHRIFGQDVTLWGPTHLMLFGGAGMTLIGRASLLVEGERAARRERQANGGAPAKTGLPGRRLMEFQKAGLMGGFLIGMSTFQGEFDFGVPQFQLVFHPMLIAFAAGIALVTARLWGGRGAALIAVAFFVVVRGLVSIFVHPIMGQTLPHFPLYIVEGLLVEGVAFAISTRKPIRFGAWCGLAIGTIGFAAEWAWSHIWMPLPWPSSLMPEGLIWAVVAGLAGGLLGALIGSALGSDRKPFPTRGVVPAVAISFLMLFVMVGYGLKVNNDVKGTTASFQLQNAPAPPSVKDNKPGRWARATVKLHPANAADNAKWVTITAWQGGALVVDRLHKLGEGVYQSTKPFPVHGDWKALLRIHRGDELLGTPIYLPNDPAIPAKGVPAKASMTRSIGSDHHILQREAKSTSGILPIIAYLAVLGVALGLCALMAWGLRRLALDGDAGIGDPGTQESTTERPWIQRPARSGQPTAA